MISDSFQETRVGTMTNRIILYNEKAVARNAQIDKLLKDLIDNAEAMILKSIKNTFKSTKDVKLAIAEKIYRAEHWKDLQNTLYNKKTKLLDRFFSLYNIEINELKKLYPENTFKNSILTHNWEQMDKFITEELNLLNLADASKSDILGVARMAQFQTAIPDANQMIASIVQTSLKRPINNLTQRAFLMQNKFHSKMRNSFFDGIKIKDKRYIYAGNLIAGSRPFCKSNIGKIRTKKMWQSMDNGQTGNAWETQGGWNCRHVILLVSPLWTKEEVEEFKGVFK